MDKVMEYGINLLRDNPEIRLSRRLFDFNVDSKIEEIISGLGLDKYKMKIVERKSEKDFQMNWHIDDMCIFRNSKSHCNKYNKQQIIPYCKESPPIYTVILYYSTIDVDFIGGEFCFVDEKIKPVRGLGILFDSREVHRVNRVRDGLRESIVVKLY